MQGVVRTLGSFLRSSAALKDLASCLGGRCSLGVHSPGGVEQSSSVHTEAEGRDTGGNGVEPVVSVSPGKRGRRWACCRRQRGDPEGSQPSRGAGVSGGC